MIIEILDSSLRDGAQGEGISFTTQDKLAILKKLDSLGVPFIEGGMPGANPRDVDFFSAARNISLSSSVLVAFGSTRHPKKDVSQDTGLLGLLECSATTISIYGKSHAAHVAEVLKTSLEENISMIYGSIMFLSKAGKNIFFDAEHFFDGYKHNPSYAMETLRAARAAGAHRLILCDTNGGTFPDEIHQITRVVVDMFPDTPVGIHCHDDNGCAVANSIAAINAGATQVQGTFLGFGERCGNARLSTLIPALQLKLGHSCIPPKCMGALTEAARYIAEVSNIILPGSLPYVGKSAFAHKGGAHVDGVWKNPTSFEQIPPEAVGNDRNVLLSDMAGRSALLFLLQEIDPTITKESEQAMKLMKLLKEWEHEGYVFESASASLILRLRKSIGLFSPHFEVERFQVVGEQTSTTTPAHSSFAMIKVRVGEQAEISAAEGSGPVHALDVALKKAVSCFYPSVEKLRLIDYKVRVLEPSSATAASVRVLITSTDGKDIWTTIGVSCDIIQASLTALTDALYAALSR